MKKLLRSSAAAAFALVLLLLLGMWLQPNEAGRMLIKDKDEGGGGGAAGIRAKGPVPNPGNPCRYTRSTCKPPK
ncbi:hypothetical protein ACJRO7_026706 [Eucalyptus globulus]|uniref:Uncharacterized protein n=1 Tax=Eucalyptus globulus TaxID=34317 RepID=A0ABD3JRH1_EUCGL